MLSPGESHTDSVVNTKEPYGTLLVTSDQGQKYNIILLSLVVINSGYPDTIKLSCRHHLLKKKKAGLSR